MADAGKPEPKAELALVTVRVDGLKDLCGTVDKLATTIESVPQQLSMVYWSGVATSSIVTAVAILLAWKLFGGKK